MLASRRSSEMNSRKPYGGVRRELTATDKALADDAITDAELPSHYRAEAAKLRRHADTAETIEMRITLLDGAEWFDRLAETVAAASDRRGETPT